MLSKQIQNSWSKGIIYLFLINNRQKSNRVILVSVFSYNNIINCETKMKDLKLKITYNNVISQAISESGRFLFAGNRFGDIFVQE